MVFYPMYYYYYYYYYTFKIKIKKTDDNNNNIQHVKLIKGEIILRFVIEGS
jgi:hypothetical protein